MLKLYSKFHFQNIVFCSWLWRNIWQKIEDKFSRRQSTSQKRCWQEMRTTCRNKRLQSNTHTIQRKQWLHSIRDKKDSRFHNIQDIATKPLHCIWYTRHQELILVHFGNMTLCQSLHIWAQYLFLNRSVHAPLPVKVSWSNKSALLQMVLATRNLTHLMALWILNTVTAHLWQYPRNGWSKTRFSSTIIFYIFDTCKWWHVKTNLGRLTEVQKLGSDLLILHFRHDAAGTHRSQTPE